MNATIEAIKARIFEIQSANEGISKPKIEAMLIIEDYEPKDIKAAFKEVGLTRKNSVGFNESYYDWLAEAPRTEQEASNYLEGRGEYGETSPNIIRHKKEYMKRWNLAKRIWDKVGSQKAEEPKQEEPEQSEEDKKREEEIKKAWGVYNQVKAQYEKGNKPNKARVHPDKVAHLKDEELTKAYNELFQKLNTRRGGGKAA